MSLLPALSSRKLRLRPVCDTGEVRVDVVFTGDWLPSRLDCWLRRRLDGTKVGVADPPGDGAADVRLEAPDLLSDVFSLNAVLGAVLVGFPPAVSGFGCLNVFSTPFVSGDTLLPGECGLDVGSWRLGAALMRTCLRSSGEPTLKPLPEHTNAMCNSRVLEISGSSADRKKARPPGACERSLLGPSPWSGHLAWF